MISSTFYDLRQIRSSLVDFLTDDLGFEPLVSELGSFPVDPDVDTIENCRRRVEQDTDILVLVIGGRYGWVDGASARSVTNLEYLAARAKGIPIYAFVQKSVLALLPVWKKNPEADFSDVVDDVRLFAFIEQVRSIDRVWTYEFEYARDIIAPLRSQIAYLAAQGIDWARRLRSAGDEGTLRSLRGRSLRIALEKPGGWEYKLFAQALIDELDDLRDLRRRQTLGLCFGAYQFVGLGDLKAWNDSRMAELKGLIRASEIIMNENLNIAFGPPGVPGDLSLVVFCSKGLAELYREAIEWSLRVRRVSVDERYLTVISYMTNFAEDLIEKIEGLGPSILEAIEELEKEDSEGERKEKKITLSLNLPGVDEALVAINKFTREIESEQ